jgi:hypothetical protein
MASHFGCRYADMADGNFESTSAKEGEVYVGLSEVWLMKRDRNHRMKNHRVHFAPAQKWNDYFCVEDEWCAVADGNGDGKADIIAFQHGRRGTAAIGVYVGLSDGTRFARAQKWNDYFCIAYETCAVADVDGDAWADVIAFATSRPPSPR